MAVTPFLLTAQDFELGSFPLPLPQGTVGVPYEFNFGFDFDGLSPGDTGGAEYFITYTPSGGTPPPGLSVRGNGEISGVPTTAGTYSFNIRVLFGVRAEGQTVQIGFTYDGTLLVQPGVGGLATEPGAVSFSFVQGSATASSSSLSVVNRGAQPRSLSVSATTGSGGNWLSVSGGGSVAAFSRSSLSIGANPAGLPNGVYTGQILITAPPDSASVSVIMTITNSQPSIRLSQTGLNFRLVTGVNAMPEQSFVVFNGGAGVLDWTAAASTLSGGSGWLSITPAAGTSTATSASAAAVRINPAGLAPGDYYGQIEVRSNGVANSPQTVSVLLNILPQTVRLQPEASPTGLIFLAREGGANPALQSVRLTSFDAQPVPFSTSIFLENGKDWLTVMAPASPVTPSNPVQVNVQAKTPGLAAGIYRGEISLRFTGFPTLRRVDVLFIVLPRLAAAASAVRSAEGCRPARLLPLFTLLGGGFQGTAGWPTPVELRVVDDCGDPMTSGSVVVSFSNNDAPLPLSPLPDGRWSGTWQPRNPDARQVVLTASAQVASPALSGSAQIGGSIAQGTGTPIIATAGAVSAASFSKQAPLAPGSMVSIFGSQLATSVNLASQLPLSTDLGGTRVTIAGRALPLIFTNQGQINAVIPYDLPVNTTQQLLVRRGTAYSLPEPVVVAAAQPAVFTKDQSGKGAGIVVGAKADGSRQ
ncbi:MAG: hypothetical protein JJE04_06340, partial [Acidobacteriia bacterium]|nr:hypothetical protein [Terriglobia bacterium]